ncbi:patatin-like phospholipase family protein [Caballeronia sp.]|uniref:patatin-like phospholipase family protein n=1 Tax=Caballeronia sp. TaxID=1931223 RepID=UPI003C3ED458
MPSLFSSLFQRASSRNRAALAVRTTKDDKDSHASSTLPCDFQHTEFVQAGRHRAAVGLPPLENATQVPGLAISGGGIRSAVFSLGVLQALADRDVLKHFSYVSTVSGGSYIGSFYGSLFVPDASRTGNSATPPPPDEFAAKAARASHTLRPKTSAPAPASAITPIAYLRDNCNYLAPNGMSDVLQSIAFSLRNWFALQYVIGMSLITILLWISLVNYGFFELTGIAVTWPPILRSLPGLLTIAIAILIVSPLSRAYWLTQNLAQEAKALFKILPFASLVIVIGIALASLEFNHPGTLRTLASGKMSALPRPSSPVGFGSLLVVITEIFSLGAFVIACIYASRKGRPGKTPRSGSNATPASSPGLQPDSPFDKRAFVDHVRNSLTNAYTTPLHVCKQALLSGPIQVMIWTFAIAIIDALGQLFYACSGGASSHPFGADSPVTCIFSAWIPHPSPAGSSSPVAAMLGVLASSGAAVWAAAKFLLSNGVTLKSTLLKIPRIYLASVAAVLAALVTLTFWSIAARAVAASLGGYVRHFSLAGHFFWTSQNEPSKAVIFLCFLAATSGVVLLLASIDGLCVQFLNLSTYQRLYSVRLTRAFIGATNAKRLTNEESRDVTSLVEGDSISMGEYFHESSCAPVHLINTTINKTIDWNSSLVQRGARGMIMSVGPAGITIGAKLGVLLCEWKGANDISTKARHVLNRKDVSNIWVESLTLGDWIAISGAAVSTGLGQQTHPGYSLLFGIANIRLGYWWDTLSTPIGAVTKKDPQKRVPIPDKNAPRRFIREKWFGTQFCLTSELLGLFDGPRARRWYLTDGGHFENTGAYELLRRRLEFIVILDNGWDSAYAFADLANLMRRVRVDFGVEITESPCKMTMPESLPVNEDVVAKSFDEFRCNPKHLALRLMTAFPGGRTGQILVIKPRLTSAAPHDVRQYKIQNHDFPQETTADQFFDDVQWESHRQLGYSQGRALFG